MVYNAMKLFMEVNPQLFDDCSHEYTESQNNSDARKKERQDKWDQLSALARSMRNGAPLPKTITHTSQGIQGPPLVTSPNDIDKTDPLAKANENAGRLASLKLADESSLLDRQPSASVVR